MTHRILDELLPATHMAEIVVFGLITIVALSAVVAAIMLYKEISKMPAPKQQRHRKHQTDNVPLQLKTQLLNMVGGNRETAWRLVCFARANHPGHDESWYWEKAIEDLIRDRR